MQELYVKRESRYNSIPMFCPFKMPLSVMNLYHNRCKKIDVNFDFPLKINDITNVCYHVFFTCTNPFTRKGHIVMGNFIMLMIDIAVKVSSALNVCVGDVTTCMRISVNKICKNTTFVIRYYITCVEL